VHEGAGLGVLLLSLPSSRAGPGLKPRGFLPGEPCPSPISEHWGQSGCGDVALD